MLSAVRFTAVRVAAVIAVAVFVSLVTFYLLRVSRDPVDVVGAARGIDITSPTNRAELAQELGTDGPLYAQYVDWLKGAVRGDLGTSYLNSSNDVSESVRRALPVNLELVILAQIIALAVSIPLGLWAGSKAGGRADKAVTTTATAFVSYPGFALSLVLIMVFSVKLDLFPATAAAYVPFTEDPLANLHMVFLPALALAVPLIGGYTRVLRSDVTSTMQEDFILAARTKGVPRVRLLTHHALRPSSLSLIPMVGLQFGALLGGSILVEQLFAFPTGLGTMLTTAAVTTDVPVLLGVSTVIAIAFAIVTLIADSVARIADPRIKSG